MMSGHTALGARLGQKLLVVSLLVLMYAVGSTIFIWDLRSRVSHLETLVAHQYRTENNPAEFPEPVLQALESSLSFSSKSRGKNTQKQTFEKGANSLLDNLRPGNKENDNKDGSETKSSGEGAQSDAAESGWIDYNNMEHEDMGGIVRQDEVGQPGNVIYASGDESTGRRDSFHSHSDFPHISTVDIDKKLDGSIATFKHELKMDKNMREDKNGTREKQYPKKSGGKSGREGTQRGIKYERKENQDKIRAGRPMVRVNAVPFYNDVKPTGRESKHGLLEHGDAFPEDFPSEFDGAVVDKEGNVIAGSHQLPLSRSKRSSECSHCLDECGLKPQEKKTYCRHLNDVPTVQSNVFGSEVPPQGSKSQGRCPDVKKWRHHRFCRNGVIRILKSGVPLHCFKAMDTKDTEIVKFHEGIFTILEKGTYLVEARLTFLDKGRTQWAALYLGDVALYACNPGGFKCSFNYKELEDIRICHIHGVLDLEVGNKLSVRVMKAHSQVILGSDVNKFTSVRFTILNKKKKA